MIRFCPNCRIQLWAVGDALAAYFRCECGWVSENWPRHPDTDDPMDYLGRQGMTLHFGLVEGPL